MTTLQKNAGQELNWFLEQIRPRQIRTMREFAEQEVIIPDGPFAGRRFRCDRQPYTRLWFDAVDSGTWNRLVATGPTQSGKTLSCFVIPILYHLFEIGETVICGLPDMDMSNDKWRADLLPAIERSRFRRFMPTKGSGSRGGHVESIQFTNGATLKFMSGGGGDKSRAGFTSRVVVITETDGMDQPGASSRESDKITQFEARTRAYGNRKRIYMECTVSTEQGRTWQEYQQGTTSQIVLPCPHCRKWVTPEREHLVGWQEAQSQADARDKAKFFCPGCGEAWSEADREAANRRGYLIHRGQEITEENKLKGKPIATDTLGFRWSAVNNMFVTAGDLGADEWRSAHAPQEENAEKEMRQFVWTLPVSPDRWEETALAADEIARRQGHWPRGLVPPETLLLTAAMDLGKYLTHWAVVAWGKEARGHVVDYGRLEVPSGDMAVEQALMVALRQFRDLVQGGWPRANAKDKNDRLIPREVWIDAGYMTDVVYSFCREAKLPFRPSVGRGASQERSQWYNRPTSTGNTVKHVGEGFHINWQQSQHVHLVEIDADHWKTWVHQRLTTPLEAPGAMTVFQSPPNEHLTLARHLTSERKIEEFIAGKGVVTRWERVRKQNHWLDALYNACAAGSLAGVRLIEEPRPSAPRAERREAPSLRPDGRPWINTEAVKEVMGRYFG